MTLPASHLDRGCVDPTASKMYITMIRLSQFVLVILLLSLDLIEGFYRGVVETNAWSPPGKRRNANGLVAPRTCSSRLCASFKFKNVEEMLDNFREEPLLISFTAINCGPCKLQKKELQAVSKLVGAKFNMVAIDTDRWPRIGTKFSVGKLPCLVVLKNGVVLARLEGLTKAEVVADQVRAYLL